ncbi:hypothetical protein [Leifsonia sp. NPDC058248]|uniref:hypothetical protein n=1 Tax=Leifsonia sp. NPDC058248 TaxID=3346402 RepID=UPI0036D9DBE5
MDRVKQAESEFSAAEEKITDKTTLADASEQSNSAAVALEFAWLRLFAAEAAETHLHAVADPVQLTVPLPR